MNRLHVVAGVIYNAAKTEILISLRGADKHQGNLWEFPGGKVESGEEASAALVRELKEEVNIDPISYVPLLAVEYDYPDKSVLLDVWQVNGFSGEPLGMENQQVRWVLIAELTDYAFPAANQPILDTILRSDV